MSTTEIARPETDEDAKQALTLSDVEQTRLAKCEKEIADFAEGFVKTGKALHAILEGRLYRELYSDFDTYCSEKWGFRRQWAHVLMRRFRAFDNVSKSDKVEYKPAADSKAIIMISEIKDPEKQVELWNRAASKSEEKGVLDKEQGNGKVFVEPDFKIVTEVVNRSVASTRAREAQVAQSSKPARTRRAAEPDDKPKRYTEEFKEMFSLLGQLVRLVDSVAKDSGGHTTLSESVVKSIDKTKGRVQAWKQAKAEKASK